VSEKSFVRRHRGKLLVIAALTVVAAATGGALGVFLRLDLPDVRALEDYAPPVMSRVLSRDGATVDTFAEQRRMLIGYHDIPAAFRDGLIATEDAGFLEHTGIDFKGIARAVWTDLRLMRMEEGASTLTMQLARDLFLHRQKTVQRKLQEMVLALEIERHYTKEEILTFYANQVYMGHGRYGVEAAARFYFGKPARDLTLPEAAMLAGVIQRPESLSPRKNIERATARRNHVLSRMVAEGRLDPETARAASSEPIVLAGDDRDQDDPAPYFVEDVRRWLKARYGDGSVYQEGLEVRTTLDLDLQKLANEAVDLGLRQLDKRQGWRGAPARVPEGADPTTWAPESWSRRSPRAGRIVDGVISVVDADSATVRVGDLLGVLDAEDVAWTGRKKVSAVVAVGDVVRVRVASVDESKGRAELALEQDPAVEAALVAIDPSTGEVLAMCGGFDFARSEFNRATQARRQTGSAFKPIVFASALAHGWTLSDSIMDEPTVFLDARNPEPYQPENYGNKYYGRLTLRRGLEKSANIATVKLLDRIGFDGVIDLSRRLGIRSDLRPYPSLGLGAFEITLLELTSAYATFANRGVHVEPYLVQEVRDHGGDLLFRNEPDVGDAVRPQIAFLMNRSLEGVITDGTGRAAAFIDRPLAGKTGTTDDFTDAWFVGYAPDLAVGVWVGFDVKKSLGSRETGAQAALPIWSHFMERALAARPRTDFERPEGIVLVPVDRDTGLRINPAAGCEHFVVEAFVEGTEPTAFCTREHHRQLLLPYPLQRYPINESGELEIPSNELDRLLASDMTLFLSGDGREVSAYTASGTVSMTVRRVADEPPPALPETLLERFDPSTWTGKDGRPARIEWVRD